MRFKEFFIEGVAETQDVLDISRAAIDYIIMLPADKKGPGTVFILADIPGLPKPTTPEGKTIINAVRIKIVSDEVLRRAHGGVDIAGDAAPYYTNEKGEFVGYATNDARISQQTRAGRNGWGGSGYDDIISDRTQNKTKLDVRLNANYVLDNRAQTEKALQRTMTHELGHILDTVKGRNTIQAWQDKELRDRAEELIKRHEEAKKLVTPENPNPPGLLTKEEEKRAYSILRRKAPALPIAGTPAYYKDPSEINARLMEAAEKIADQVERLKNISNKEEFHEVIRWALSSTGIPHAFISYPSDAAMKASYDTKQVTAQEWRQAMNDSEFRRLYNRIYKFLDSEKMAGGVLAQAEKDNFKNWAKIDVKTNTSLKQEFIERFKNYVIKGIEAVKDVAKTTFRYTVMADQQLAKLLERMAPGLAAKLGAKSIPFVGILLGVAFAIPRLFDNDIPGAGLEVATSVGSVLTAIPGTAYIVARDLYGEYYTYEETGKPAVFEYDYANDPKGTEQRVRELADEIAKILREKFSQNSPSYPQAFQSTQGGAAVGNPNIARQGQKAGATQGVNKSTPNLAR